RPLSTPTLGQKKLAEGAGKRETTFATTAGEWSHFCAPDVGMAQPTGQRKKKLLAAASLAEGVGCVLQELETRLGLCGESSCRQTPQRAVPPVEFLPSLERTPQQLQPAE
ncbi:hypothetical protein H1C71_037736, partial [Ictidomys tridecemlineatus]